MTPDLLREKLEELKDFVLGADSAIRAGQMVNVQRLERDIAVLCKNILALPAQEAQKLQPPMADLIGDLERLSLSLKEYKDTMKS